MNTSWVRSSAHARSPAAKRMHTRKTCSLLRRYTTSTHAFASIGSPPSSTGSMFELWALFRAMSSENPLEHGVAGKPARIEGDVSENAMLDGSKARVRDDLQGERHVGKRELQWNANAPAHDRAAGLIA